MKNSFILFSLSIALTLWPSKARLQILSQMDSTYLDSLGSYFLDKSDLVSTHDSSFILTDSARICFQLAGNHSMELISMNGLAGVKRIEEKILEAEVLIDEAIQKLKYYELENNIVASFVFNTAGVIQQKKGDFARSTKILLKALNHHQKFEGTKQYDSDLVASMRQTIGQNYQLTGDFFQSIEYLEQALDMRLEMKKKNLYKIHRLYLSLGATYKKLQQFDLAEKWLRRGLIEANSNITTENKKELVVNLSNHLAEVLRKTERYDQAIAQLETSRVLIDSQKTHLLVISTEELGFVYLAIDDLAKAETQFLRTLDLYKSQYVHLDQHPKTSLAHLNLAKLYHKKKNYKKALEHLQLANINNCKTYTPENLYDIPTLEQISTPLVGLQILQFKAEVLGDFGRQSQDLQKMEAALASYQLTSDLIQHNRRYFEAEASKRKISGEVLEIYENAIGLALELYQQNPKPTYLEQAFSFAEGNKAAILSEKMQSLVAIGQSGLPDSITAQEQELSFRINYLKEEILQAKEDEVKASEIKSWEDQLFATEEELSQFTRQLEEEYPAYFQAKYSLHKTDLKSLRTNLLKDNTGLIEYFVGQEKSFLFLLTKDDIIATEISDWEKIPSMVNTIRELIHQGPNSQNYTEDVAQFSQLAATLYEKLLSPVLDHKTPLGLSSLIVIPDDVISYLPFELLLKSPPEKLGSFSSRQLRYLIQDYSISYAYSTHLLLNQAAGSQQEVARSPLLAYAPSFGTAIASARASCTTDELYSLQCSQGEVEEISELWSGDAIVGSDATLASFIEKAANARILHLATHACIDEYNSERNKIFFSDQALTGIDLQAMKLHPELTILSACNTGTGQLARGEGILSLARDFRLAGSPSTLTSLWSVDDCATSKIMTSFHQHLFQGKSKAEAIRAAKLDFLATADKEQSHPYFWAAFVQYGDISPLRNPGLPSWLIYSAVALLVLALLYGISKRRKKQAVVS